MGLHLRASGPFGFRTSQAKRNVPKQRSNSGHSLKGRFRLVAKGLPPEAWRKIQSWRMCVRRIVAFLGLGALQYIALV